MLRPRPPQTRPLRTRGDPGRFARRRGCAGLRASRLGTRPAGVLGFWEPDAVGPQDFRFPGFQRAGEAEAFRARRRRSKK